MHGPGLTRSRSALTGGSQGGYDEPAHAVTEAAAALSAAFSALREQQAGAALESALAQMLVAQQGALAELRERRSVLEEACQLEAE